MGRYQEGLLGHFLGKVGTVIGSSWKGVGYMRRKGNLAKRLVVSDKIANQLVGEEFLFGDVIEIIRRVFGQ